MADSNLENILSRLTGVKPATDGNYVCNCPGSYHEKENNRKLYVKDLGEVVALDCKSGCTGHEIMGAIGLQLKDLYPAQTELDKQHWREIQAQKKQEQYEYEEAFQLWLELKVLTQALEGRIWGEDKHPKNRTECWDREKQALKRLKALVKGYYR